MNMGGRAFERHLTFAILFYFMPYCFLTPELAFEDLTYIQQNFNL